MTCQPERDSLWQSHIQALVDAAPPLTQRQINRLAQIFDSASEKT